MYIEFLTSAQRIAILAEPIVEGEAKASAVALRSLKLNDTSREVINGHVQTIINGLKGKEITPKMMLAIQSTTSCLADTYR